MSGWKIFFRNCRVLRETSSRWFCWNETSVDRNVIETPHTKEFLLFDNNLHLSVVNCRLLLETSFRWFCWNETICWPKSSRHHIQRNSYVLIISSTCQWLMFFDKIWEKVWQPFHFHSHCHKTPINAITQPNLPLSTSISSTALIPFISTPIASHPSCLTTCYFCVLFIASIRISASVFSAVIGTIIVIPRCILLPSSHNFPLLTRTLLCVFPYV